MPINNKNTVDEYLSQTNRGKTAGLESSQTLAHQYDAFRAYGWLISIDGAGEAGAGSNPFNFSEPGSILTMAARSVGVIGYAVDDITIAKINDKYYYPGKVTTEETVLTFDNLLSGPAAEALFDWMTQTYNPLDGTLGGGKNFKTDVHLTMLDHEKNPKLVIHLHGAYCKNFRTAEFNYATNDFHTVDVSVRYDYVTLEAA